jgi:hypothetical protein
VCANAATMTRKEIEWELGELARACEGPRWLLEARRWRLEFELKYRERANGAPVDGCAPDRRAER